jgi:ketosteroid isomerase-like protein
VLRDRVELVRAMFELWNAGDRDFAVLPEYVDPAIELESPFSSIVGEPYRGYAGIEQWTRDIDEQFVEWSISPYDVREVGVHVIAMVTVRGRGRSSNLVLQLPSAGVFNFAGDDRITHVRIYPDVHEALKAVGLKE